MKSKESLLPTPEDLTLDQVMLRFSTDENARQYLEEIRWSNGVVCPHCKNNEQTKIWEIKANKEKKIRAGLYQCGSCKKQFTVTVGTIFEDSHIPLRKWLIAWYLLCSSKKGISSLQIQRMLDLGSYRSALFMMHRIRHALRELSFTEKMTGIIEADETYIGGKTKGKGAAFKGNKTPVVSLVQRDGQARSVVMEKITSQNLMKNVKDNVLICSTIMTDDNFGYRALVPKYDHCVVKHSAKEYARKEKKHTVHTNTVEGFFSLIKRGIIGTFHSVSKKHLPLYLAEFDYRWNQRKVTDGERTFEALKKAEGKRLTYKPLTT